MKPTVFVTDGDQRPALAIVRSLGRAGATVIVGEERASSLAAASRYCARAVAYPSPAVDPVGFERFLVEFVRRERVDVLVPVTDITTRAVARQEVDLKRFCATTSPPLEAFELVADKARLLDAAAAGGVRVPRSVFVADGRALDAAAARVTYPAVIKPVRSRLLLDGRWIAAGVHYAGSEPELRRLYASVEYLARGASLVQERIAGDGVGVFVLCDRGTVVAEFAHRRLRERPPSGGASVLRESIAVPQAVRGDAGRLLGPLGWHGVAMLEYKHDAARGEFLLMEVNGRFWGSLQLAIDAGIDFPRLACELALGRPPADPPGYATGVKSRWLLGDLDHLLLRLTRSRAALDLPAGAPTRLAALAQFLRFAEPDLHYEVVSRDDPGPFRHELRVYAADLARAIGRRLRRRPAPIRPLSPVREPAAVRPA